MPNSTWPLSAAQIKLLKRWIDAGAEWPETAASPGAVARSEMIVTDEDRKHWSYLPLKSPPLPAVKRTAPVRTPVDRFIIARPAAKKLSPLTRGKTPADYWAAARAESRRTDSTQQRRAMAEWMTDVEHGAGALLSRVMVNRVWQHHFGQVPSPLNGERVRVRGGNAQKLNRNKLANDFLLSARRQMAANPNSRLVLQSRRLPNLTEKRGGKNPGL